jgi:hypothetical protein
VLPLSKQRSTFGNIFVEKEDLMVEDGRCALNVTVEASRGCPIVMGKVSRLLPYPKTSRRFFWGITPLPSGVGLDESRINDFTRIASYGSHLHVFGKGSFSTTQMKAL